LNRLGQQPRVLDVITWLIDVKNHSSGRPAQLTNASDNVGLGFAVEILFVNGTRVEGIEQLRDFPDVKLDCAERVHDRSASNEQGGSFFKCEDAR
jgi:hypothetical protein